MALHPVPTAPRRQALASDIPVRRLVYLEGLPFLQFLTEDLLVDIGWGEEPV
jgi:hypothetical protein